LVPCARLSRKGIVKGIDRGGSIREHVRSCIVKEQEPQARANNRLYPVFGSDMEAMCLATKPQRRRSSSWMRESVLRSRYLTMTAH
jgi:hypothetical protein